MSVWRERRRAANWTGSSVLLCLCGLLGAVGAGAAETEAGNQVENEIARLVMERAPVAPSRIEVPALDQFVPLIRDLKTLAVEVEISERERFQETVPVTVTLLQDGKQIKRGVVTARLRYEEKVVVAARDLARGEVLELSDLKLDKRDRSEIPAGSTSEPESLVGMRTERALAAGAPIAGRAVERIPLVKRKEIVRLHFASGSLKIAGVGEARHDAGLGELVRVLNVDSRREVVGRVIEKGVVDVTP